MNEPRITINRTELSEAQSRVVRIAVMTFLSELNDPRVASALGNMAIEYHIRLTEVMVMIDNTPVEMAKMPPDDVLKALEFIAKLVTKAKEGA